jgi:hypothetical protein
MKRRWFLTTVVAGAGFVAGCTTSSPPASQATSTSETGTQTPASETTSNEDIQRRISIAGVDEVPDEHDLRIEIELLQSTVTDEHTAHLRLTATDETSRKRRIGIGTGQCNLFNREKGESEPPGLWLYTPERAKEIDRADNRWTKQQDSDKVRAFADYGCAYRPTVHNEPIINEYLVWDDSWVDGYMTPGTYRFAAAITVGGQAFGNNPTIIGDNATTTGDTATTTTEPASEFTWGFSLAVENPNK